MAEISRKKWIFFDNIYLYFVLPSLLPQGADISTGIFSLKIIVGGRAVQCPISPLWICTSKGLWVYVDSLYSTYLVVQIRLSYDDSIYLVIEIMTYDKEFFMKDKKKEEKVKIHVQR